MLCCRYIGNIARRIGTAKPHAIANSDQFCHLFRIELVITAELLCHKKYFCKMLQRLHLVIGIHHIATNSRRTVIFEQIGVVIFDILPDWFRYLRSPRRTVFHNGYSTQRDNHLGQHTHGKGNAGNRKTRRRWRMCMNHSAHIGTLAVKKNMHPNLRRRPLLPTHERAIHIRNTEIFDLEKSLRHPRWRRENAIFFNSTRNIAIVRSHKAALVHAATGFNNIEFGLMEIHFMSHSFISISSTTPTITERTAGNSTLRTIPAATP